jgi:GTP-binding protein
MSSMPVIAIVGRPNVGKSSLLNALVGKRISIVQDMPGVTRDRISTPLRVGDKYVELVDTGGYGYVDPDQLTEHIKHQIELAMTRADLVLFLVDTQVGLTSADEQIAALLRKKDIKTVLVANKADGAKMDTGLGDFARLGLGTPLGVSATNDRNIEQIYRLIEKNIDLATAPTEIPEPQMLVAIVGKRNAGKSTFVNSVAEIYEGHGDRVIVSEIPGTTRDSVDVRFEKEGKTLIVIDTAGVRKKRHMVTNDIEFYSFHRAQRSIRRADVVLMLIDATEPVSEPDKKLAQYVAEQMKPVVLVINKWDLAKEKLQEQSKDQGGKFDDQGIMQEYKAYLDEELRHVDYAPIAFITAKEGKNVQVVLDLAQKLFKQANERLTTGQLNRVIKQIFEERRPSTPTGRRARIYYATQTGVAPPTIVLFVNNPDFLDQNYQRFMINRFRELLPYAEVPILLQLRGKVKGAGPGNELAGGESDGAPRPRSRAVTKAPKRKAQPKPHPKKTAKRGPTRGTRPRHK